MGTQVDQLTPEEVRDVAVEVMGLTIERIDGDGVWVWMQYRTEPGLQAKTLRLLDGLLDGLLDAVWRRMDSLEFGYRCVFYRGNCRYSWEKKGSEGSHMESGNYGNDPTPEEIIRAALAAVRAERR